MDLLARFNSLVETLVDASQDSISEESRVGHLKSLLCDICCICQILNKMEMMNDLVRYWVDASVKIVECSRAIEFQR